MIGMIVFCLIQSFTMMLAMQLFVVGVKIPLITYCLICLGLDFIDSLPLITPYFVTLHPYFIIPLYLFFPQLKTHNPRNLLSIFLFIIHYFHYD